MNSWFDKVAYTEARYGAGSVLKHAGAVATDKKVGMRTYQRLTAIGLLHVRGLFKVFAPSTIAIVLSIIYGGHYAAITHSEYIETAHHGFNFAFTELTELWDQVATVVGLSNVSTVRSVVDFLTVIVALLFAVFAGIGALFVQVFQMLFDR